MPDNKQLNPAQAMEGRTYDREGKDAGDAWFHEVAMGTTPAQEHLDLEAMAAQEIALGVEQAQAFAERDATLGAAAYRGLAELYPAHPEVMAWKRKAEELDQK